MRPFLPVLALLLLVILPKLVEKGLFVDGLLYATLARNMAEGVGSFWQPHFTSALFPVFYDHPPLALGLAAAFFRVLGDAWWVEKVYSLVVLLVSLYLISRIWQRMTRSHPQFSAFWPLPLCLWLLNEDVYLSYPNHMLECTLGVFTLGATLLLLRSVDAPWPQRIRWQVGAALLLVGAFLCKGPVALFPLAFYPLYRGVQGNLKASVGETATLVAFTCLFMGALMLYPPARSSLLAYWDVQVMAALRGARTENIAPHRFFIVSRFLETHAHWLVLSVGLWRWGRRRGYSRIWPAPLSRLTIWAWLMGAVATLPIMISIKQGAHYILPATPFFALALAAGVVSTLSLIKITKSWQQVGYGLLVVVLAAGIWQTATHWGAYRRQDRVLLRDLAQLAPYLSPGTTVFTGPADGQEWSLYGYLARYHRLTAQPEPTPSPAYALFHTRMPRDTVAYPYRVPLPMTQYDLYRRHPQSPSSQ